MKTILIEPRGFCFGVRRALALLEKALPQKPYVLHEIVHNKVIIDFFKEKGACFVEDLSEVPDGSTVVFSAHGVGKEIESLAAQKKLRVIDTTCPFVKKVHAHVEQLEKEGYHILLIGKKGHAEVIGTLGRLSSETSVFVIEKKEDIPQKLDKVGVAMQTTLSQDETDVLLKRIQQLYPNAILENGICFATTERQTAVKNCSCPTVLVVGDTHSSNAKRLVEVAKTSGKKAYLIETPADLRGLNLQEPVGITAAASAPESMVQAVYQVLSDMS